MTRPGRTEYSPFRMCTSVPQIVVSVTRTIASPTPARGRGTSRTSMWSGPRKTFARIVAGGAASGEYGVAGASRAVAVGIVCLLGGWAVTHHDRPDRRARL